MGWLFKFVLWLIDFLPDDTFISSIEGLENTTAWLGYMNYFVPINRFLGITTAWLALIIGYRVYRVLKRIFNRYLANYTHLM